MTAAEPPVEKAPPAAPLTEVPTRLCENCHKPLLGDHCYSCGQPTKGLVRQFSSIIGDFFDTVLNLDSRVLRTLWPLFASPGYLSLEYFAGRRVRYVTPMRLYLFLSIVAFFAMQSSIDVDKDGNSDTGLVHVEGGGDDDAISQASTPEQVNKALADAEQELNADIKKLAGTPGASAGLEIARKALRKHAKDQIGYLKAVEQAKAEGKPTPPPPNNNDENFNFPINGKPWDPESNPITATWLPDPVASSLNRRMARARDVLKQSNSEKPILDAVFRVSPQVLFVLMPIFALLLKLAFVFKRRLYMEHLIVALHSHSFISLALIVVMALAGIQQWLLPTPGFFNGLLDWMFGLTIAWIPLYLLLMQKRVYHQGWPMTLIKFGVLGVSYSVMLGFGLMTAVLVGLLTL